MIKRGKLLSFVLSMFASVLSFSFVSAASYGGFFNGGPRQLSQQMIDSWVSFMEPFLQALFGGLDWTGLFLFEKLLLFIVLVSIVYLAVGKIPLFEDKKSKTVRWIISIIVPLIAVRYLRPEWISAIITQYTLLAIILTAVLPFLIYFFFVYNVGEDYGALRKIMWLLFIGIYAGLWSTTNAGDSSIYAWTTIVAIACLFLDGKIMKRYRDLRAIKQDAYRKNTLIRETDNRIMELNHAITNNLGDPKLNKDELKQLESHRKWLARQ